MASFPRFISFLLLVTFASIVTATQGHIKHLNKRGPGKFGNDVYEIVGDGWQAEQAGQNADDANQAQRSLDQYTVSPLQTANAKLRRGLGKIPGEVPDLVSAVVAQPTVGNTIATPIHNTAENLPTPPPGTGCCGLISAEHVAHAGDIAGGVNAGVQTGNDIRDSYEDEQELRHFTVQRVPTTMVTRATNVGENKRKRTEHLESTVTGW